MLEVFDMQFKNAIRYGMTYSQFWFDDPKLYYIYQESFDEDLKLKDIYNWQLGQYIMSAIGACFADKGKVKYPEKPMFFAREKEEPLNMKEKFLAMVEQINKNFK